MLASPGCWEAYGALLAREYEDQALFAACHRLTVDAYALQHPGDPSDRRATRSVWLHFVSLHAIFAHGYTHGAATALLGQIASQSFGPLPPAPDYPLTLADLDAGANGHVDSVRLWARGAYDAWRPLLAASAERLIR